jgi:alginate O-acetyltransferase complex protein AlgI
MLFNSLTFLVFFALVLAAHRLPISWTAKKRNLLLASYLFYAAWNPPFVALLWISTLTDWFVARGMASARNGGRRRLLLFTSLGVNLGLLAYFKYAGFVLENFVWLLGTFGVEYQPPALGIVLPLGISFYTFQTLSYSISVYRREMQPWPSFLDFALFVTFFPQLVAGPIVRAQSFLPQCVEPRRANARQLGWGLTLLTFGLFQKVILADNLLAPTADLVFGKAAEAGTLDAWIGTFAFSGQILFDFAGYSLCAIGTALCLGFVLPDNFDCPYAARGFSDFWRRWHISLSSWLRDYLYIPLGGNRGSGARTYVNLMLTMLLGGLWHGAAWNFVVWGALHGAYLAAERKLRARREARGGAESVWPAPLAYIGTFLVVGLTWIFFRAENIGDAFAISRTLFSGTAGALVDTEHAGIVAAVVGATLIAQIALRDTSLETFATRLPAWLRSAALAAMICSLALAPGDDRAFIYFQF